MSNRLQLITNIRLAEVTNRPDAYEHYNAIVTRWFYRVVAAGMFAAGCKIVVGICQLNGVLS